MGNPEALASTTSIPSAVLPLRTRHYKDELNLTLILSCALLALSSFNYGFDDQAFASTQAMDAFAKQFGEYDKKTHTWSISPVLLSLLNSLHAVGQIIGIIIGSIVSARYGRRWCVFSMSAYALVSSVIVITSKTMAQMQIARILHYVYLGMELVVVPVYVAEVVPPRVRGGMVGTYWLSVIFGGLIMNVVTNSTNSIKSNLAWQIPMALFFIIPSIVLSLVWFIPESPRWLLLTNRRDKAIRMMRRLRRSKISDDDILAEINELEIVILKERQHPGFGEIFRGKNYGRTHVVVMMNFFQQVTGQAFASQYGAIFVKSLHSLNAFKINLAKAGVNMGSIMICLFINDKIGRRPLIIFSALIQLCSLMTMGALGVTKSKTVDGKIGIISMLLVYSFGYSVGWAPLTYVLTTELPAPHLRDSTQRLGLIVKIVCEFTVSFTLPYLLDAPYADLEGKLGFIYGAMAVIAFVWAIFYVPECKGLTLEEIDVVFERGVRMREVGQVKE